MRRFLVIGSLVIGVAGTMATVAGCGGECSWADRRRADKAGEYRAEPDVYLITAGYGVDSLAVLCGGTEKVLRLWGKPDLTRDVDSMPYVCLEYWARGVDIYTDLRGRIDHLEIRIEARNAFGADNAESGPVEPAHPGPTFPAVTRRGLDLRDGVSLAEIYAAYGEPEQTGHYGDYDLDIHRSRALDNGRLYSRVTRRTIMYPELGLRFYLDREGESSMIIKRKETAP